MLDSLPKSDLPPLVPHFTGRENELKEISSLITSKSSRFVNIWGSPGFGKTSTAIAVAHHLQSQGHPVYFSTFRGRSSKEEFISKILSIFHSFLKSKTNAALVPSDKLLSIFREIPCRFFLVLDNLDDLLVCKSDDSATTSVKDEVVDLIKEILVSCPNVALLTTTRESLEFFHLKLEGYEAVRIRPLDQLSSNRLIHKFLPSATKYVLSQIAKISGNVPLAIKLACSFISESTEKSEQLLDDLIAENLLEILDNADYPDDLRLKKLIEFSFCRLSQSEKNALISSSAFLGSDFNADAAVAVIGGNKFPAERSLSILVRKSLIDQDPDSKMFSIHPLLQWFVLEKGENQLKEVVLSSKLRFYNYYLLLFENLNEQSLTGNSMKAYMSYCQENKNIRVSLVQSLSHEGLREKLFEILAKSELFIFYLHAHAHGEIYNLYDLATEKAKRLEDDTAYSKLFVSKSFRDLLVHSKVSPVCPEVMQKNIDLMRDGTREKLLCVQGFRAIRSGDTEVGVKLVEKGHSNLGKSSDQQILKCLSLQLLSVYYSHSNNLDRSAQFSRMALDLCKEIGDARLFLVGECQTSTESAEEKRSGTALSNQPLIVRVIYLLSFIACDFLSAEMNNKLSNAVYEMQRLVELEMHGSNYVLKLLSAWDTTLYILASQQESILDDTIQSIKANIKIEENNKNEGMRWVSLLQERLANCYFLKIALYRGRNQQNIELELQQQRLDIILELHCEQHPETAQSYTDIGITQHNMEDYVSAVKSYQRALNIRLKLLGEEHLTTAESYYLLAVTQHQMEYYVSALNSCQRALDIRLKLLGEEHLTTAESYCSLGMIQHKMEDYVSALKSKQRALDIRLKLLGEEHLTTAESYCSLGITQYKMEDYVSAIKSEQRALDIILKLLGEEHLTTAESYCSLGMIQHKMEDYVSALKSKQRGLDIRLKLLGEEHLTTAESYCSLGITQYKMEDYVSAIKSEQRALDIRLKLLGEEHLTTTENYCSLGITQYKMEDYASALKSEQRALDIRLKLLGEEHLTTAESYCSLGITQNKMEDYASALKSKQRALDIRLKLLGEEHLTTAESYYSLGITQNKMKDYVSALKSKQRALDIRLKLLGEEHLTTAENYDSLGNTQHNMEDYVSAVKSCQCALDIRIKLLGEEHLNTVLSSSRVEHLLTRISKFFKRR